MGKGRYESIEYGVSSIGDEHSLAGWYGDAGARESTNCAKVQIGLRPVQKCKGGMCECRVSGMLSFGWLVAGPGRGWRDCSTRSSIQSSAINAALCSVLHSVLYASSMQEQLCRDAVPTLPKG